MTEERLAPIHPGEILLEEFLKPMGISQYRLAKDISVPARRINERDSFSWSALGYRLSRDEHPSSIGQNQLGGNPAVVNGGEVNGSLHSEISGCIV